MSKSGHDSSIKIARRWIPWLRTNNSVAIKNVGIGWEELKTDLAGLSPTQLRLVCDLVEQMRICNEEDKKLGNQINKYE